MTKVRVKLNIKRPCDFKTNRSTISSVQEGIGQWGRLLRLMVDILSLRTNCCNFFSVRLTEILEKVVVVFKKLK